MILFVIFNLALSLLSFLIPKNQNQILMGSHDGTFADNTKYFFLYLLQKKHSLIFYWITKNKKLYQKFKKQNYPVIYLYSFKGFITILRSNFLLVNQLVDDVSFFQLLPGKFNIINLWHGTPFKRITIHDIKNPNNMKQTLKKIVRFFFQQSFTHVISTSDITSERLEEAFNSKNFPIIGYPRNDVFFNKNLIFENYEEIFNLDRFSKVFLYCPTLRDEFTKKPFSNSFLKKLNQYLVENDAIFLIKWHTFEKNKYSFEEFSRIKDVSEKVVDLQELLLNIDILVTDYSSVSYDFSLLEKPIIFYHYDYEEYLKSRNVYSNYFEEFPGPFVKNENNLLAELQKHESIFKNDENVKKFNEFKNKFNNFQDGNSCKRLIQILIN